jgi:membrane protein implicated in regulation of membrane protease activity
MSRVSDYVRFVTWLLGIGYVVLWPLTAFDHGQPLGAPLLCAYSPLAFLCDLPHPLALPPGLQLIGLAAAACVCLWLALRVVARWRRARAQRIATLPGARIPVVMLHGARRRPLGPLRQVKPRSHFGLRDTPR